MVGQSITNTDFIRYLAFLYSILLSIYKIGTNTDASHTIRELLSVYPCDTVLPAYPLSSPKFVIFYYKDIVFLTYQKKSDNNKKNALV